MKIAFDIDGVLIDTPGKIEDITQTFFDRPDFTLHTYYAEHLREEKKVREFVNSLFGNTELMTSVKPAIETVDFINRLKEGHKIFILTARPPEMYSETLKQCMFYFGIVPAFESKKADFIERNNIRVLVEDCLENAISCASSRRQIFLIDKPYNQGPLWGFEKQVIRVDNLLDIEPFFNGRVV